MARKEVAMSQHLTVKELPASEKPYEKFLKEGAQALSDAELLAVIIKSGTVGMQAVEVARNFLSQGDQNLLNLYEIPFGELVKLKGIGTVKAIQLKCVAELSKRIARTSYHKQVRLGDAKSIACYYMEQLRHEKQERLVVCMFDSKCRLMGDCTVSVGTANASIVSPREVFLAALQHKAVHIILVHNHPSGVPMPSGEDDLVTERIHSLGQLLDIPLSDHIIIGDGCYYSYRESGKITERKG
ncbi:MAG: DNA repair protein RadC [Roseburia sp.]